MTLLPANNNCAMMGVRAQWFLAIYMHVDICAKNVFLQCAELGCARSVCPSRLLRWGVGCACTICVSRGLPEALAARQRGAPPRPRTAPPTSPCHQRALPSCHVLHLYIF